ncbi:MAG: hypothetical protein ACI9VR_004170 [Cognaticolwellia sp.]|jgi:hypothetical protein
MWLLWVAVASAAVTRTVSDGDVLATVCLAVESGDTIEIDPARSVELSVDKCDLYGKDNVIVTSSTSGVAEVGGITVVGGSGVVLENLRLFVHPDFTDESIFLNQASDVVLTNIYLAQATTGGVYAFDAAGLQVQGLHHEEAGGLDDHILTIGTQPAAAAMSISVTDVTGSGPGAKISVVGPAQLEVTLQDLDLTGGEGSLGGCVQLTAAKTLSVGPEITLYNAQLHECSADTGGALYMDKGVLDIQGGSITSSQAATGGGAYFGPFTTVTADGLTLRANVAPQGAALAVDGGHFTGSDLWVQENVSSPDGSGGAVLGLAPSALDLSNSQLCGNLVKGFGTDVGSALTLRGGKASLDHVELRGHSGGTALLFLDSSAAFADLGHLSVWDNSQDLLIAAQSGAGFTLRASLMAHAEMGYVFPGGSPGTGFNYWYQVSSPNAVGSVHGSDLTSGADPLLTGNPVGTDCSIPLNLDAGSPLIDQAGSGTDPDGTVADIGAHAFDQVPDTGDTGETGETGETGPETGDSGPQDSDPQDSALPPTPLRLLGGCGRDTRRGTGAAVLLLGLAMLGAGRRQG